MSITKVCGIETEYGIVTRGVEDQNPIAASSILISAYLDEVAAGGPNSGDGPLLGWDFEDEQPDRDARGFTPHGSQAPDIETNLVNAVLTNGARYYVDHAHPELATPECSNARSVVVFDRAAERILELSMNAANRILPPGQEIVIYKNNSDGKGNSYGCHENYMMDRETPFGRIVSDVTPHFITRQIFCGAGKVGCEAGLGPDEVPFQISQRADFFEEEVGLETTLKRPIINTRDEPHADPQKYRRLHVIIGDANMSEIATFLKVGSTAIVLAMIEDDFLPTKFSFAKPIRALRSVSYDLTLRQPLALSDGTTTTALAVQWELFERATLFAGRSGLACVGEEVGRDILAKWEEVLTGLESDPMTLADQVDWVAKYRLIEGYRDRHGLEWSNTRLNALDLQYHDLRSDRSLSRRVGLQTICNDTEIEAAMSDPPLDTRAYFRGMCLKKFGDEIVSANWDSLVFDTGEKRLRRVPMLEPLRGTEAHVGSVVHSSVSAAELLESLGT